MSAAVKAKTVSGRPIIFSGPMVRAILEERKTQTRRVVVSRPDIDKHYQLREFTNSRALFDLIGHVRKLKCGFITIPTFGVECRHGKPGDRLWVRETFMNTRPSKHDIDNVVYRASFGEGKALDRWSSPIHMPRWASRLTLEITDVRVERLQEISFPDIRAEGFDRCSVHSAPHTCCTYLRNEFSEGWNKLNAKRSPWSSNAWVWVIEFKPLTNTGASPGTT